MHIVALEPASSPAMTGAAAVRTASRASAPGASRRTGGGPDEPRAIREEDARRWRSSREEGLPSASSVEHRRRHGSRAAGRRPSTVAVVRAKILEELFAV
jgi:hypothetical protein